jgi:carbamoyl-phosphate synthase large subunit
MLRTASLKIAENLGIIGECNVQIGLDPNSNNYKIIEVNPRLSRSSALASKATGYPIASVAAQLCLGEQLSDIKNVVTGNTTANFEPSLDYLVVKIPKWDTLKFRGVDRKLGSAMKSVGEIMAIGRNFEEAFQKGLRMVSGIGFQVSGDTPTNDDIFQELTKPTDDRIRVLIHAILSDDNCSQEYIHKYSKIDNWFLSKLFNIKNMYNQLVKINIDNLDSRLLLTSKQTGFSDNYLSILLNTSEHLIREKREEYGIQFRVKQIDTLAGEYPTTTNYLYTSYCGDNDDKCKEHGKKKIIVLGSGKYRIGSSVEFDYCSVKTSEYLRTKGYSTVMINYNPETMSTDFDNSDKLYFEELSVESVCDIYIRERAYGIIICMGGQEPNNIAVTLYEMGLNILGTGVDSIDKCENRFKYSSLLDKLKINQPAWITALKESDIYNFINKNNYPILIRPSYVLSGAAMQVIYNIDQLKMCLKLANNISPDHPIVLTKFYEGAKEIDLDAVACQGNIVCYAISEHLEDAGVHSGDATLILPCQTISEIHQLRMIEIIKKIANKLLISGPFNTQFLIKDDWVGVIETNLRASRSIPFVSKTLDIDFIKNAVDSILYDIPEQIGTRQIGYVGVKCPQFSFNRLPNADPILGVEMGSTGEVACYGKTLNEAYLKALVASRCGICLDEHQTILKLDKISNTDILQQKGHQIITNLENINWDKITMVIDCSNSEVTRTLRRCAIDFSKYLITNKNQLHQISKSLGTHLEIQPYTFYKNSLYKKNINLFIRQGFTESNLDNKKALQTALTQLANYTTRDKNFNLLTGNQAESKDTFKQNFTLQHMQEFTPNNFRNYRLNTLQKADAMIIFRTGLSESTVFEVAYNIFKGNNIPIFYAIQPGSEIKTTLLRELDGYCNSKVIYKVIENGIQNILDDNDFKQFLDMI